ncbi:MAG: trypsin-like peptidase domain-containing protein, partial [Muribaculaceae bacterium]|nr:trypsin-like peptidase domain-containing protein [Muribaculaceae bacterium]
MKTTGKLFLALCAAAILGSTLTVVANNYYSQQDNADRNFIRTSSRIPSSNTDFTVAAENTINCVVSIKTFAVARQQYQGNQFFDPFEFFFGHGYGNNAPRRQQPQQPQEEKLQPLGLGSGVIISTDGYIVTNNHVIKGGEKLEVTLNNNEKYVAKVIGSDESTDLALLKIDAKNLSAITFGSSDNLKVGEWVLAVGNPFGFTSTVTAGIVSAKARNIGEATSQRANSIDSFIQTDAAVNQGNSGGALVNINGELVGINTAIYSHTGNYAGYSFAIPSSTVSKVVKDLKEYGSVQRAVLG